MLTKSLLVYICALMLLAGCGLSPEQQATLTATATRTLTPTQTLESGRYYAPDGTFSFIPPEGWLEENAGVEYPVFTAPIVSRVPIMMVINQDKIPLLLAFYTVIFQDSMVKNFSNCRQISEDFLKTNSQADYFRWELENVERGETLHIVFYMYESTDWKLI